MEGTAMNFSHDNLLTALVRPVCGLVLIGAFGAPPSGASSFNSPQRPAVIAPVNSTAIYKSRSGHNHDSPYLAMIGPAPLSFASGERPLPPEPVLPALPKTPNNTANSAQKSPVGTTNSTAISTPSSSEATDLNATITTTSEKPISILPDDTRREIRAEDVLPFFQFPGAPDGGALAVPFTTSSPRGTAAPPSSATYKQQ
jgi:hypothetical protein